MKTTGGEREVLKLILFLKDQSFSVMGVAYLIKKSSHITKWQQTIEKLHEMGKHHCKCWKTQFKKKF